MRTTRAFPLIAGLLLASGAAQADQFAYISLPQAVAALQAVPVGSTVHAYCAPCGDARSTPVRVAQVGIDRIWDGASARAYRDGGSAGYWTLAVNGRPVDLAYVYVRSGTGWENLALRMGLDVALVPRTLPAARTGR